ncbi:MAG: glycoside hydrolase family 15 protein [Thermodesulfobacteriota bacterium]
MTISKGRELKLAYQPIEQYGIIGDMNTVALISLQGSIDWFCFPYLDSPSVFAALLDDEKGGRLTIRPTAAFDSISEYIPQTNILVTSFRTRTGVLKITDFMPVLSENDQENHEERHVLYRLLEMDKGQMEVELLFQPRFDYGRARTSIRPVEGGVLAEGGGLSLALTGTQAMEVDNELARAVWSMQEGDKASFKAGTSNVSGQCSDQGLAPCDIPSSLTSLQETEEFWRSWLNRDETGRTLDYGCFQDMVERSVLVLKLLYFEPEGTIAAAATTSLPEFIGGERNWDYRYTWIRDTSFTLQALFNLGHMSEIEGYLRWIERILAEGGAEKMQIMYGLRGERKLPELELSHLEGYKGSRPVRIGNAASDQKQMDIYGELLDAALKLSDYAGKIRAEQWPVLREICDYVTGHWQEPDYGIWEVRDGPWHFVYSKVMCWVALDRGLTIAKRYGFDADLDLWGETKSLIHAEVCEKGYSKDKQAFVQHYQTDALDASSLLIPLLGFLPFDDPRVISTVDATMQGLTHQGLVYRYRSEDGMQGDEGTFLLCSFWLVTCLIHMDRLEEAEGLIRRLEWTANHLGLFSEEYDVTWKEQLGNFPQAFTHIGYINSVTHLVRAKQRSRQPETTTDRSFPQSLKHTLMSKKTLLNAGQPESVIPPQELAPALKSSMNLLRGGFFDTQRGRVAYELMKGSELYENYVKATRSLQAFDPGILKTREEKTAFWINLYNVIVIHGVIELDIKDSIKEVRGFFRRISYAIGGLRYTPDDMEHGLLRANRRPPGSLLRILGPNDPKCRYSLNRLDPRIHFALVCASSSCPPIDIYTSQNLDEELNQAGRSFLGGGGLQLDRAAKKVSLSRIFSWYRKDFGSRLPERLRFLAQFLYNKQDADFIHQHAEELKVKYQQYDWRLNRG